MADPLNPAGYRAILPNSHFDRAIGTAMVDQSTLIYQALSAALGDAEPGTPTGVAWDDITAKPVVIAAGATAAEARAVIGAGTSSLTIGTAVTNAAAGNHTHTPAAIGAAATSHTHAASTVTATAVTGGTATNVQGILTELAARIVALETAA